MWKLSTWKQALRGELANPSFKIILGCFLLQQRCEEVYLLLVHLGSRTFREICWDDLASKLSSSSILYHQDATRGADLADEVRLGARKRCLVLSISERSHDSRGFPPASNKVRFEER